MTERLETLTASSLTPVCGPEKARGISRTSFVSTSHPGTGSPSEDFSLPSLGLAATPLSSKERWYARHDATVLGGGRSYAGGGAWTAVGPLRALAFAFGLADGSFVCPSAASRRRASHPGETCGFYWPRLICPPGQDTAPVLSRKTHMSGTRALAAVVGCHVCRALHKV
jgi:hypothetical protein